MLRLSDRQKAFALMSAPALRTIASAQPSTLKGLEETLGAGRFRYGVFAARIISAWIAS